MTTAYERVTALVQSDVRGALALLQKPSTETGLTVKGAADVLDEVVGQFTDPREAREAMEQHLTPERRVELLAGRGDLPSSAALVADANDVFAAMLEDLADDDIGEDTNVFLLRAWMQEKFRDRSDYADFLQREVGGRTIRDHLLALIYYEAEYVARIQRGDDVRTPLVSRVVESVTDDVFDDIGMDAEEGRQALRTLAEERMLPRWDVAAAARAGERLAARRRKVREAPTTVVTAQDAAAEAAGKIEF